jgi:peptidoglycan/LPS O-acetylase OafA/YrhL
VYGHPHWQAALSYDVVDNLNLKTFLGCALFLQKILVEPLGTNGALWSLSYEFWFYVAFPVALCAITSRLSWPWRILNAILLIGMGVFVGGAISKYFLIWLMGAALQLIPSRIPAKIVKVLVPAGSILVLGISLGLYYLKWPMYLSDVIEGIACILLCYVILHQKDQAGTGLFTKLSQGLSDMSYTLYLVHLPILTLICAILVSHGVLHGHDFKHWLILCGVAAVTLCISCGIYWIFERNSNKVRGYLLAQFVTKPANRAVPREKAIEQA